MSSPRRKVRKTESEKEIEAADLQWMKDRAVFLKAGGFSYRKISDVVRVTTSIVKHWFEDPEMHKRVEQIRADTLEGALNFLAHAQLELVQHLLDVARDPARGSDQLKAILEGLGLVGIVKVNKSESKASTEQSTTHEFSPEFFDKLEGMPMETQEELARLAGEMDKVIEESKGVG
jgi:hypothetical protein